MVNPMEIMPVLAEVFMIASIPILGDRSGVRAHHAVAGTVPRNGDFRFGHLRNATMIRIRKHLQCTASQVWERIWRALRDPYRPEQHYMRGPGPKYRAKASNVKAN